MIRISPHLTPTQTQQQKTQPTHKHSTDTRIQTSLVRSASPLQLSAPASPSYLHSRKASRVKAYREKTKTRIVQTITIDQRINQPSQYNKQGQRARVRVRARRHTHSIGSGNRIIGNGRQKRKREQE